MIAGVEGRGMTRNKWIVGGIASVAGALLLGSALLPTLCRAREPANRVKCASNLKQIGQAMLLYANENRGAYPDSIVTLLRTQDLVTDVLTCPSGNAEKAASVDALAAGLTERNCSYLYYGDGVTRDAPADAVVMIERPDDHDGDGANALFADGHVEFLATSRTRPAAWVASVERQVRAGARPVRIAP